MTTRTIQQTNAQRAAHIRSLLTTNDPFLSLAQAARKANIPLSSLSQAVTQGHIAALVMPDKRRYVAWSDVESFIQQSRRGRATKPHVLLRLAQLADQSGPEDLPTDFATNHDQYIHGSLP